MQDLNGFEGYKYIGQLKDNNIREGKGVVFFSNGSKFEGIYKNDMRNGQGKLITQDGE